MGGAQFALPGAVERLRARRRRGGAPLVLSAVDPAQPYGAALPWPRRERRQRRPARGAGAHVVLVGGEPVLYLERGGRGLMTLVARAAAARGRLTRAGSRRSRAPCAPGGSELALERIDGEPALASPLAGR